MKRIAFLYASIICIILSLMISCSNNEDEFIDPTAELSEYVKTDFYSRFQNKTIKSAYSKDNHATINFVNTNQTEKGEAYYVDDSWFMTYIDYGELSELPDKVINSFNSRYSSISDLNITKIDIKGLDQEYYNISFVKDTLNFTNMHYEVLINRDGYYLEKRHNTSSGFYPSFIISIKETINLLENKYKDARIRTYQNYGGTYIYNILDGGVSKFVSFRDNNHGLAWMETKYDINISKVPDYVFQELEERKPLFDRSNVYRVESVENNDGNYYLVWTGSFFNGIGYYVDIR